MFIFAAHWYPEEVCSSTMNPGFNCTGHMADGVYGIVRASGFLISMMSTECPMVAVGLWYVQAFAFYTIAFYRWQFECTEILYHDKTLRPIVKSNFICHIHMVSRC